MKLTKIVIRNFRLLKNVEVATSDLSSTTILVGPNNSGKTSVAEALHLFTERNQKKFSVHDFSLKCHALFTTAQEEFVKDEPGQVVLPEMSIDLHFKYKDEPGDLAVASDLLMDLDPQAYEIALRLSFECTEPEALARAYKETRREGQSLVEFLTKSLTDYYGLVAYKLSPDGKTAERLEKPDIIGRIIQADFVYAQRHIDDQENSRATKLSNLLHAHYEKHHKVASPDDHEAIEASLKKHADELGVQYMDAFGGLIKDLAVFGYSKAQAPTLAIKAELNSQTLFRDNTRIFYGSPDDDGSPMHELPEKYNGLGFKNLIYLVLQLQSFREALAHSNEERPRIHLIFIEEPEVHLHPQVQSVFIKNLSAFLKLDAENSDIQVLVSTHSSHIVADSGFAPVRYFRRQNLEVQIKDLLKFESALMADTDPEIGTPAEAVRFLKKYLASSHCDIFFANKAVLIEGQVERLLLPQMIVNAAKGAAKDFTGEYISVIEVGGAHAHKFKALLRFIGIPTLVVTDLDSVDGDGKKCPVASGIGTSNSVLRKWLPKMETVEELKTVAPEKLLDGNVRVAFQCAEADGKPCGRSFEEAFIYCNADWLVANADKLSATKKLFAGKAASAVKDAAYDAISSKVDFALDLMLAEGWSSPRYISEGLAWLAMQKA